MIHKLSPEQHAALIADIVAAEADWTGIAERHSLSPEDLSAWARVESNQQTLRGLCVLADLQTQVLMSRCRLLAATKLLSLATGGEEGAAPEVSRKACVDLLRLDMKSALAELGIAGDDASDSQPLREQLRRELYGEEATDDEPPTDL
jgi:hypothetical protein